MVILTEEIKKVNDSKYSLYDRITKLIIYSRKYILNSIPKIHNDLRINLTNNLYSLANNMFYSTYNKGNIRLKYLTELQVNISMVDMLFVILRKENIIKKHNIEVVISELSYIKNIVYGWKINEEKIKS